MEKLSEPVEGHLFDVGAGRGHDGEGSVLVPGGGEHVGGLSCWERAAGDEAEVAAGGGEDGCGGDGLDQEVEDLCRGEAVCGEGLGECSELIDGCLGWENAAGIALAFVVADSVEDLGSRVHMDLPWIGTASVFRFGVCFFD